MIDPLNIPRRIVRHTPWTLTVSALNQGVPLDLSLYDLQACLVEMSAGDQDDPSQPAIVETVVFRNLSPSLDSAHTFASFLFSPEETGALEMGGGVVYRWYCSYSPTGSGAAGASLLCAGPVTVTDAPAWENL